MTRKKIPFYYVELNQDFSKVLDDIGRLKEAEEQFFEIRTSKGDQVFTTLDSAGIIFNSLLCM